MDYTFCIISAFLFLYLFDVLLKPNPFDRVLFRREYRKIHISSEYIRPIGHERTARIEFTKYANADSFRKAVFDCKFSNPEISSIHLDNFPRRCFNSGSLFGFHFTCIDFSGVDYIAENLSNLVPSLVSGKFSCDHLVLPRNITSIELYDCPKLHSLLIPSDSFVPLKWSCYHFCGDPVLVQSDFQIFVPEHLLQYYLSDERWKSLLLCDPEGHLFPPKFVSL